MTTLASTSDRDSTNSSPRMWREGDVLVVERGQSLPDVCWLTGTLATRRVRCLFHWTPERFVPTHEAAMPVEAVIFYFKDVQKACLDVPLADALCRKRVFGWICFGLTALFIVVTVAALLLVQAWIDALPKGPEQKSLNTWLVPAIALGGFGIISCFASLCYYTMPMPTAQLKPQRITETHIWLSGAAPSLLCRLEDRKPQADS